MGQNWLWLWEKIRPLVRVLKEINFKNLTHIRLPGNFEVASSEQPGQKIKADIKKSPLEVKCWI